MVLNIVNKVTLTKRTLKPKVINSTPVEALNTIRVVSTHNDSSNLIELVQKYTSTLQASRSFAPFNNSESDST